MLVGEGSLDPSDGGGTDPHAVNENGSSVVPSETQDSGSVWELRLSLATDAHTNVGHFSLLRVRQELPILVDFNFLTREFRSAVANAVLHLTDGNKYPEETSSVVPERSVVAKAASAG